MKQTLLTFPIKPLNNVGTAPKARLAANSQFQSSTSEVHLAGDDQKNYTEYTLTANGDGWDFPTSIIDSTPDALDNKNSGYTLYIVNSKGKFIEAVFENWTFPASLGTTISYTDLAGANQKRVPLRDDQSYSKTATDNLLAGRTFSTPATTTN